MLVVCLTLGLLSLESLRVQLMPDYQVNHASVSVRWEGVSVDGMDRSVAIHLDRTLNSVPGVERVTTTSYFEEVFSYIEFEQDADLSVVLDQIETQIVNIAGLPEGVDAPVLKRADPSELIGRMSVVGPMSREETHQLSKYLTQTFRNAGINRFSISGAAPRRWTVAIDANKAVSLSLDLAQIQNAIDRHFSARPSFQSEAIGGDSISVRTRSDINLSFHEVEFGSAFNGLRLKDIATIELDDSVADVRSVFREGAGLFVRFERGPEDDILEATAKIESVTAALNAELPRTVSAALYDMRAYQIRDRISLLATNGLMGLLFVFIALYLFVGLKVAFWVSVGLPVVLALSFALMNMTNQTINMVSVFTIVMVLGILVDDSIVVAESIAQRPEAPFYGVLRTWRPVTTAMLTTIVAFLPILILSDEIGAYVSAIPMFVAVALIASLLECFVLLPNHLGKRSIIDILPDLPLRERFGSLFKWFLNGPFAWFIHSVVRWRAFGVASCLAALSICALIVSLGAVRFDFWLNPKSNFVFAHVTLPNTDKPKALDFVFYDVWRAADEASRDVTSNGQSVIQTTFAITGRHIGRRSGRIEAQKGSILIELKDDESGRISQSQFLKAWQAALSARSDGAVIEIEERLLGLRDPPITVTISGEDFTAVRSAAKRLISDLEGIDGVIRPRMDVAAQQREAVFTTSAVRKVVGIDELEVLAELERGLGGIRDDASLATGDEITWRLRYAKSESLEQTLNGLPVELARPEDVLDLVELDYESTTSRIRRRDGSIALRVTAQIEADETSAKQIRQTLVKEIIPGVQADFAVDLNLGGRTKTENKLMRQVVLASILGVGGIFFILSLTMRSLSGPLLVLAILPFGVAGMIVGHFLIGVPLTLLSLVALIGLFGVIVNDSILLLDAIQREKREPNTWSAAIHMGYSSRLRAVLLTTITTIAGLLPLISETSYQAQFLVPIAVTIAFGLAAATLASVVVVPCFVEMFQSAGSEGGTNVKAGMVSATEERLVA